MSDENINRTSEFGLGKVEQLLGRWHRGVIRFRVPVLLITVFVTVLSGNYVASNLGINTDTADLLSEDLPWRAEYTRYKVAFPQYVDTIAVVVESSTPDRTADAAALLSAEIRKRPALFEAVYHPQASPFFQSNQLLFLEPEALQDLSDQLVQAQPLLARLSADNNLLGFASVLTEIAEELTKDDDLNIGTLFEHVAQTLAAHSRGQRKPLSWQALMTGQDASSADRRQVFVVKPRLDFSTLLPGSTAVHGLRALAEELQLNPENGVRVRLTGGAALGYEELRSVQRGAQKAGWAALILVSLVLTLGLRSPSLILATLLTLVTGLILTAAFATVAIGELNLISIAFAVLYIGLGVDFAIHYCLRFNELLGEDTAYALERTTQHVGGSLMVCAITTAIGFLAFIPTDYSGVAELGLITGAGIFISLVVSLSFLPALLSLLPNRSRPPSAISLGKLTELPNRHPRSVVVCASVMAVASIFLLPHASFDHNPIHLQDPTTESVSTYHDLLRDSADSPLSIVVLGNSYEQAMRLKLQLEELPTVDAVISFDDFVPRQQTEKLAIISDLSIALGIDSIELDSSAVPAATPTTLDHKQSLTHAPSQVVSQPVSVALSEALVALSELVKRKPDSAAGTAAKLHAALTEFVSTLAPDEGERLSVLEQDLLGLLPPRLTALKLSLEAQAFTASELPPLLRRLWISDSGVFRLEVLPKQNMSDNVALEEFVNSVRSIAPDATGAPIVNVEASTAVVQAFQQAFATALIFICLVLIMLLPRRTDLVLVLCPLLLAGLYTGALVVVIGTPFNFANIIALPLLLGIGVDSAVHMLHRHRTAPPQGGNLLNTSTSRAVVFSTLTTVCGFGNLALSTHRGTASMGVVLTIGIGFTLLCTLILLPSLLAIVDGLVDAPLDRPNNKEP